MKLPVNPVKFTTRPMWPGPASRPDPADGPWGTQASARGSTRVEFEAGAEPLSPAYSLGISRIMVHT